MELLTVMKHNTRNLIIQLLNQELKKANHIATLYYHEEIKEAKKDFIDHVNLKLVRKS
tara:strand:- start:308 stop:481 length:174 start_codon:yes stop_codon:yes gene_type:complete